TGGSAEQGGRGGEGVTRGNDGEGFRGGDGLSGGMLASGGGGGGYFGGGSGGHTSHRVSGAGGGGGSFVPVGGRVLGATGSEAGGRQDPDYADDAGQGTTNGPGRHGRVVIRWSEPA
ncbi:MAG: PE family protein, partial [Myxococcota bacterium]